MRGALSRLLGGVVRLERHERARALLMLAYSFNLIFGLFVLARIAGRTLYLKRLPGESLPYMYLGVAALGALAATAYTRVVNRVPREPLLLVTLTGSGLALAVLWVAVGLGGEATYPLVVFVPEALSGVAIVQFWTLAGEIFTSREAKRVFGVIGLGGVLASLAAFGVRVLASVTAVHNLLLLAALHLLLAALCVRAVCRHARPTLARLELERRRTPRAGARAYGARALTARVQESAELRAVLWMTVATFVAVTLVDYQFNLAARAALGEEGLAAMLGTLLGLTGVGAFFVQLVVTSRLLERWGVLGGLLVLPAGLALGVCGLLAWPGLAAASAAKSCELLFRYTVNDATTQLLYVPVMPRLRARAKAFIDGVIKPLSTGLAGVALAVLAGLGPRRPGLVEGVTLALLGVWVVLAVLARREYLAALLASIQGRSIDPSGARAILRDESARRAVLARLGSDDSADVLHALELLAEVRRHAPCSTHLLPLLGREDPRVRAAAVRALPGPKEPPDEIVPALELALLDPDEGVRVAAVETLAEAIGPGAARLIRPLLEQDGEVRDAAVRALLRCERTDDAPGRAHESMIAARTSRSAAVEVLAQARKSADPARRARAARLCADVTPAEAASLLPALLEDPVFEVRRAALEAAGRFGAYFAPALIDAARDARSVPVALRALRAAGPDAERVLVRAVGDPERPASCRALAARALGELASPRALACLAQALGDPDLAVRHAAAAATARALRATFDLALDVRRIERALDAALAGWAEDLRAALDVGALPGGEAVRVAMEDRVLARRDHALVLVELLHPGAGLDAVALTLERGTAHARANAIEIIDNLHRLRLRRPLVALLEAAPGRGVPGREQLGEALAPAVRPPEAWLAALAADSSPFVAACARHSARALGFVNLAGGATMEAPMLTAVDKVLRLRKVELLAGVPGEELVSIAHIAEEERFPAGDQVFAEGEIGDVLYLIVEGEVRVHRGSREISRLGPGQCFGELSLLDREPRSASVTALSDVTALTIRQEQFAEMMQERPELASAIVRVLTTRLRSTLRET